MAKKKIGCSSVHNGVARGMFTIPDNLKRGVYELLGEYQGNEVYQPSYDSKYLIIGLGTEFQGIDTVYQVDEYERELTITGRLVGYDELNNEVGLENREVSFKIGALENPLDITDEERSLDASYLKTVDNNISVTTGDNGFFTFNCYVPSEFKDWEYQLFIKFNGDFEYVSCVKSTLLRVGLAPTTTIIDVYPSKHLHPESGAVFRASVYLQKDIDDFGNPKTGAERITYGNIIFKSSLSGLDDTWYTLASYMRGQYPSMRKQDLNENNGFVTHRYMFGGTESDVFDFFIYAQYSGSREGIGYKPSKSRVINIFVDEYGDKLTDIRMQLETLEVDTKTVFYVYGEYPDKLLTFDYGSSSKPVPIGYTKLIVDEEIEDD